MTSQTQYTAKQADSNGLISWSNQENHTWNLLISRQLKQLPNKACNEYLQGLKKLNLPQEHLPQLGELNRVLQPCTGWTCKAVPALISFDTFFKLLASRQFPVATFIRTPQEIDYLEEPDIFHEIFGHCAMLTHPAFAAFTQMYGQLGLNASHQERIYLARLYWFTVEFGLLNTADGIRIFGGGILSSPGETEYVYSGKPTIKPFELLDVLRTPYRIDIMQPIYFTLDSIEQLFELSKLDLLAYVHRAISLGLHPPTYPSKQDCGDNNDE